jgi:prophage regulatory protein
MRLIRIKQVVLATSLSRMTIYRLEQSGNFPARRRLGQNSVAWSEDEINEWLQSRPKCSRIAAATASTAGSAAANGR